VPDSSSDSDAGNAKADQEGLDAMQTPLREKRESAKTADVLSGESRD
jgi:hypothetical protein